MGRKPIGDVAMSAAERVRLFRARHAAVKPAKATREDADRLNARVRELEAALVARETQAIDWDDDPRTHGLKATIENLAAGIRSRDSNIEKLRAKTTPERPRAVDWEDDPRTKALKTSNKKLKAEVAYVRQEREWVKAGGIPRATFNAVVRCLHPDQPPPTEKQRSEACGLFTQWKQAQRFRADA